MDADTWGNVITAATGVGAIVGGIITVSRTAKLNRKANTAAQEADRVAELRKQSREALSRVIEAATEYADATRAHKRRSPEERAYREARDPRLEKLVQRATSAAGLVHIESVRRALLRATSAYGLADFAYREDDTFSTANRLAVRDNVMESAGNLASASLREDDEAVRAAEMMIISQYNAVTTKTLDRIKNAE